MWTVEIKNKQTQHEAIVVEVDFINGAETITRNIAGTTKEEIDSRIAKQLKLLEDRDANVDAVTVGAWTAPTPAVTEPTKGEKDRDLWLAQWRVYQGSLKAMQALSEANIAPTAEETARFEALKTWIADNRKPEYAAFLA